MEDTSKEKACLFCEASASKVARLEIEVNSLRWKVEDREDIIDFYASEIEPEEDTAGLTELISNILAVTHSSPTFLDDLCGPVLERTTEMDRLHRALTAARECVSLKGTY